MGARVYAGGAIPTTTTTSLTNISTTVTLAVATGWLTSGQFSVVIDPGLSGEEKCLCTLSGTTLTFVTRGYDGTTATSHNAGATIYPVPTAVDFTEANTHINATTGVHGIVGALGWTIVPVTTASNPLVSRSQYHINYSSTGACTLTLPAAPSIGDEIRIIDSGGLAGTNNITVLPNGLNVQGAVQNLVIAYNNATVTLIYNSVAYGWKVS